MAPRRRDSDLSIDPTYGSPPSQLKRKLDSPHTFTSNTFAGPSMYAQNGYSPMEEDGSDSAASPASQAQLGMSGSLSGSVSGQQLVRPMGKDAGKPLPERTGRACLACRRLKTRCDGADDPPCRRCRQGNHECIFVESKRGKRPAKKPAASDVVAEKFKNVEATLGSVLQAMSQGQQPDMRTLQQIHELSAAGVQALTASPTSSGAAAMTPITPAASYSVLPSPRVPHRPSDAGSIASTASPNAQATPTMNASPSLSANAGTAGQNVPSSSSPGAALNLLAEASLAAELDGRKTLTGLDDHFRLHSLTGALQFSNHSGTAGVAPPTDSQAQGPPALLTKRILNPTTAVELFRLFFDFCYLHLPILDPSTNTATAVCQRSPFLFTTICAVGARFHTDRNLERLCYEEAQTCFVNMVARGERSIDSVHACLILTVWSHAPHTAEDRIRLAWQYFSCAVRLGLELALFRPPSFSSKVKMRGGVAIGTDPWGASLQDVPEDVQRDALNRERTWMLLFIVDRYISAALGRPPTLHDCKPFLLPSHPLSLPFDLGIIAHLELQSIVGQVMETFHDRIFGHSSTNDDMPSPVVIKLFNARLDEWRSRWARSQGDPVSANLLFYYHNSVLYLNSIPLQSMLRTNNTVADPDCVSKTVTSARAVLDLCHEFSNLGVLRHCPDLTFLYMLFANVFLIKLKLSQTSFNAVMKTDELLELTRRAITDCSSVQQAPSGAAAISAIILGIIYNQLRSADATSAAPSRVASNTPLGDSRRTSVASESLGLVNMSTTGPQYNGLPVTTSSGTGDITLAPAAAHTPGVSEVPYFASGHMGGMRLSSGANTPSAFASGGPNDMDTGFFDSLLNDSLLVSQGEAQFLPGMFSLLNSTQASDASQLSTASDG